MKLRICRLQGAFGKDILVFFATLFLYLFIMIASDCKAGIISDRVAAFVDDEAITCSELQDQYRKTLSVTPDITIGEVLDTMINRLLILREAKKYRIEEPTQEEVIREYIDLKVRAFIRVTETEIETYYEENSSMFSGKVYDDVRDEIEQYLTEKDLNRRLKEIIREFRKSAYIKVLNIQGQKCNDG
ncbi:MAG: SurA N-terminal domain-containing protein [Nitrospirota bacterium]|nr:SurA N-terminal domain-containing protein [Nitrospirota bacterium]